MLLLLLVSLWANPAHAQTAPRPSPDWASAAEMKPRLKVLVGIEASSPLTLADLALLSDRGLTPADRAPALVLGREEAVFKTSLGRWLEGPPLPSRLRGKLLDRFQMTGIYRVGFKVEEKNYRGPLTLEVTAPRGGFGRRLLSFQDLVRPRGEVSTRVDPAGNRWVRVRYPEIAAGQNIRFHFAFRYLVEMAELLGHDLALVKKPAADPLPPEALPFLQPGYKIDPALPAAAKWARERGEGPPDAREEFSRLSGFLARSVAYDQRKREEYFGGRAVYSDLDQMYQDLEVTLSRKVGACPDTVLLECSFLRARGVPCRTAGRFGHFFSLVFVPGRGWMSTSVTPTGIPLIVSPGPDHLPYQNWTPRTALRTTQWEGEFQIETLEELP